MQQNADQSARTLFFAFIVVCLIAAIFALGTVANNGGGIAQSGGINSTAQGDWTGGDNDGDEHEDDDD